MHNKFIDLEQLFRSKNPGLLRVMPRFALRYLKKIIHEEDVNAFMHANKEVDAFTFSENVINKFNIRVIGKGLENVPKEGGYVFCCNHPLGGLDAMALVTLMRPIRKDIRFVVNDLLLHLSNLKEIFTGVNKHGKTTGASLKHVDELFKSDLALFCTGDECFFPFQVLYFSLDPPAYQSRRKDTDRLFRGEKIIHLFSQAEVIFTMLVHADKQVS